MEPKNYKAVCIEVLSRHRYGFQFDIYWVFLFLKDKVRFALFQSKVEEEF